MQELKRLDFQEKAVQRLFDKIEDKWRERPEYLQERYIYFKAPTGAGKTVMMGKVLELLTDIGKEQNYKDRAFIWLTPRPTLAHQSKKSIEEKYALNCLGLEDNPKELKNNQVFFCNWEIIRLKKGIYGNRDRAVERNTFYKMLDKTKEKREIVVFIDEAHFGAETSIGDDILKEIEPAVIVKLSATIEIKEKDDFVQVTEEEVIEEELITKEIQIQSKEELEEVVRETDENVSRKELMIKLASKRREELLNRYKENGVKVNPLVLIQLPNISHKVIEKEGAEAKREAESLKESEYYKYLVNELEIEENKIAIWLSVEKENLDKADLSRNDSNVEYLFFKTAIATGWDCPRAKILVVLRESSSKPFKIQTIGRIRRMPEQKHYADEMLNVSFVYTEYNKGESEFLKLIKKDEVEQVEVKRVILRYESVEGIKQEAFQKIMREVFVGKYPNRDSLSLFVELENPKPKPSFLINLKEKTTKKFNEEIIKKEREAMEKLGGKRVLIQEELTLHCGKIIEEGRDECGFNYSFDKVSDKKLERALRVVIGEISGEEDKDKLNGIVLYQLQKEEEGKEKGSFKRLIRETIRRYGREVGDKERRKELEEEYFTNVLLPPKEMSYITSYDKNGKPVNFANFDRETRGSYNCIDNFAFRECWLSRELTMPEERFVDRVLRNNPKIEWWYKQKDFGSSVFGVKYYDGQERVFRIFYPDFIFKTTGGKLFVVDTKGGETAKSEETKDKARGLQEYIEKYPVVCGLELVGGIVDNARVINRKKDLKAYVGGGEDDWEDIESLL